MARCQYCDRLTLDALVRLAKEDFQIAEFPRRAFYEHHKSFSDLEQAAHRGCDLCSLILECFMGAPVEDSRPMTWPAEWLGSACPVDSSMYSVACELPNSQVRLAINTNVIRELDGDIQDIDAISVFNTLLVQVGLRSKPLEEDLASENDLWAAGYYEYYSPGNFWELPVLQLSLSALEDQAPRVDKFRVGLFELDPFLGSKGNFSRIREWLNCCREQHPCASSDPPALPTRVIDVGSGCSPKILSTQGLMAEYVALSHCWGGDIKPKLLSSTLPVFENALPYKSLAANFQDAITITRELGFRFLWIDSLCIIQDSKADWQQESQKMCSVYQNASLTISAMASPGSKHGILNHVPTNLKRPQPVHFKFSPDSSQPQGLKISLQDFPGESLRTLDYDSPLSSRGWTLQEGILSSRHVFYGARQVYWGCRQGFKSADGRDDPGISYPLPNIKSLLHAGVIADGMASIFEDYYHLVNSYTQRSLSFSSDKLPAFSGLAQALHSKINGQYLVGLWSKDFHRGLLWYAETGSAKHVVPYRAPSWSWAVTDVSVLFHQLEEPIFLQLELLSHNVIPKDTTNIYGEISSATLRIKGLTKPFTRSRQLVQIPLEGQWGYVNFDENMGKKPDGIVIQALFPATQPSKGEFVLSIGIQYGTEPDWVVDPGCFCPEPYLALIVAVTEDRHGEDLFTAVGLVLQRVGDPGMNTYERMGYFDILKEELSYYESWESQTIDLI